MLLRLGLVLACVAIHAGNMHGAAATPLSSWAPWWGAFEAAVSQSKLWDTQHLENLTRNHPRALKQELYALLLAVEPFLAESIKLPLTSTQRPAPLTLNCSAAVYGQMLSGRPLVRPRQVVMVSHVMAELHLMRMRYHMYGDGLVDTFVVSEGTTGHQMHVRKPLVFERHKHHFARFLDKTVHIVHDDTIVPGGVSALAKHVKLKDDFGGELRERQAVYEYLTREMEGVQDDALVVYGDADEFIDEDYLHHLKHCEFRGDAPLPFSSNAPMYQNDFRFPFRTDFPPDHWYPCSYKFPSIWTLAALRKADARKMRHHTVQVRGFYVSQPFPKRAAGFHLTSDPFLPNLLFKFLNNAEGGVWALRGSSELMGRNMTDTYERYRRGLQQWRERVVPVPCLDRYHKHSPPVGPPWIVRQNPGAFPWLFLGEAPWWQDPPHRCLSSTLPVRVNGRRQSR